MCNITEDFGSLVFNDRVMRKRLPKDICVSLRKTFNFSCVNIFLC
jgi:hypothetical protein